MIVIKLFCNAGMSTSLLVNKMIVSAKERNIECSIKAYPVNSMQKELITADVVLLGPQVIWKQADAQKLGDPLGIPVGVIRMQDYGMVNGEGVLDFALELKHKKD